MNNPLDEYLESKETVTKTASARKAIHDFYVKRTKEKTAAFGSELMRGAKQVVEPSSLGRIGAQAGVAAGMAGLAGAAGKMYLAITKKRDFDTMLHHNPDLAEHQTNNPEMFNQLYSSLRSMNPTFAKDPIVAGTYMRKMVDSPLHAGGMLVDSLSHLPKMQQKGNLVGGISALQGNRKADLDDRKQELDFDKYEQSLTEKEERKRMQPSMGSDLA